MKVQENGKVVSNTGVALNLHFIEIKVPKISPQMKPGNFVSLLPPSSSGAFLRRPFSVAGVQDGSLKLVIRDIGKGTHAITSLAPGDCIEVLGPLGNSYPDFEPDKKLWLLGGGTGIASLLFLHDVHGNPADRILWGGKTKDELPMETWVSSSITFATDDGTRGGHGNVVDVARRWLKDDRPDYIAACGPRGLLKGVQQLASEYKIPAWISCEEFMACGMGACAGCAVPLAAGGYARVCADGPVFKAGEVLL